MPHDLRAVEGDLQPWLQVLGKAMQPDDDQIKEKAAICSKKP